MRIVAAIGMSICMLPAGAQTQTPAAPAGLRITRSGAQPARPAPADTFTGSARVDTPFQASAPARVSGARVTFDAGARTAWHMHPFAPKLAEVTDDVLYADIWERPELSKRDRSLVTVAALIAMNRPDQLRPHLVRARQNGLTREELIEAITHLAFYAGWPSAVTAVGVAREVFKEN